MSDADYVLEEDANGRTLVVTGRWCREAAEMLQRGDADGLTLNYARGFKAESLDFLDGSLGVRRLHVLDRGIVDLAPIARLSDSLTELSVQAGARSELDFGSLPNVRAVGGEWSLIGPTLRELDELRSVITWRYNEVDAHVFRDHFGLQRLTIKDAPYLASLSGLGDLPVLETLEVRLARKLGDVNDISGTARSLRELVLEKCNALDTIDDIEPLMDLRVFELSDAGELASLAPLKPLVELEVVYLWGSTRVLDGDLGPLLRLPRLRELRMRDRREYRPRVAEIPAAVF